MTTRAQLVARWQDQLAISESQVASGGRRLRWLWQMRVRLYHFLLSCYGDGAWESDAPLSDASDDSHAGRACRLVDNTDRTAGLAPKSPARIRATLKQVKVANDRADAPGPYIDGTYRFEWIRVASYKYAAESKALLHELTARGIEARRQHLGWQHVVEVRRPDFDAALDCLDQCRPQIASCRFAARARRLAVSLLCQAYFFARLGLCLVTIGLIDLSWSASLDQSGNRIVLEFFCAIICVGISVAILVNLRSTLARFRETNTSVPRATPDESSRRERH